MGPVVGERLGHQLAGEFPGGNLRLFLHFLAQKAHHILLAPTKRKPLLAQARLCHSVRETNNAVAQLHLKFAVADDPVLPGLQREFIPHDRQQVLPPKNQQARVAMLDDPRAATVLEVDDSECGVTDFAHLAHRQRIHDSLRAFAHIDKCRRVAQRHGGREIGQHPGFDATAEAVGQHGDDPAFLLDFPGGENIAGHRLPMFGLLAEVNVDKAFASHGPSSVLPPVWAG